MRAALRHIRIAVLLLAAAVHPAQLQGQSVERQLDALHAQKAAPVEAAASPAASVASQVTANATSITAQIIPEAGGFSIHYPFTSQVAAAAFIRADQLFVVFDAPVDINHPEIIDTLQRRLKAPRQIDNAEAAILVYPIGPGQSAGMEAEGTGWKVTVKDSIVMPRVVLAPEVVSDAVAGGTLRFSIAAAGNVVQLVDPALGDHLLVAPVKQESSGIFNPSSLRSGQLLRTAQGIAFAPLSNRFVMVRKSDSVLITDSGLSSASGLASAFVRGPESASTAPLIDLEKWARNTGKEYLEVEGELQYQLSVAKPDQQQQRRWDIATFYIGRGLAQRALGALGAMLMHDPKADVLPQFRAARGVALLMSNRIAEAREDLFDVSLDGAAEIWLWRAEIHERERRYDQALDAFARGSDVIARYGDTERARFQLSAIRAAIGLGDIKTAERELGLLPANGMTARQQAEVHYWRGVLLARAGNAAAALKQFADATRDRQRQPAAMAELAAIRLRVETGTLAREKAVKMLERLRLGWRGDDLELDMLQTLADYYLAGQNYREALLALRQPVLYFRSSDRTRAFSQQLDQEFRDLFLSGKADSLPPVQAFALFTDFRDATPLGTDGDAIIRRISERLVDVGLYARAAELLDHQVRYRLEGTAQAVVAARLAMIEILAQQPQKALDAITVTRQNLIPDDVRTLRQRVEARALIDLDRLDDAAALIESDSTPIAQVLRSDLLWRKKSWRPLAEATAQLLDNPQAGGLMSGADRQKHIVRIALAYTMLNDLPALAAVRKRFGAQIDGTPYRDDFTLLTSGNALSPADIQKLSVTLARVDQLDAFASVYRAELRQMNIPVAEQQLTAEQIAALAPAAGGNSKPRAMTAHFPAR